MTGLKWIYGQENSKKVLAEYDEQKKELDTQMELWEQGTEGLMEIEG